MAKKQLVTLLQRSMLHRRFCEQPRLLSDKAKDIKAKIFSSLNNYSDSDGSNSDDMPLEPTTTIL